MKTIRAIGVILLLVTTLAAGYALPARADDPDWQIPQTIRVRVTGRPEVCDLSAPYVVKVIPFKDYVKRVLPSEWEGGWPVESYRAGAIAVKMYAWYWIERGGKWPDADVYDSICDQVYNPRKTWRATDQAVEDTWNWALTRNGQIFETRHKQSDAFGCSAPFCMEQLLTRDLARAGYTWDDILRETYGTVKLTALNLPETGFALKFDGDGRVMLPVDDLLSQDFTIEWQQKMTGTTGDTSPDDCGPSWDWQSAPLLLDGGNFGVALAGDRLAFGAATATGDSLTLCGQARLADREWRHLAIQRRAADGALWLFVDGRLENSASHFDGVISPTLQITLGDGFTGWLDELRISNIIRYEDDFTPPEAVFHSDEYTIGLYHFDEGLGNPAGSVRLGAEWSRSTLFLQIHPFYLPIIRR